MKIRSLSFLLPVLAFFGGKHAAAQQGRTPPLAAYKGDTAKYVTEGFMNQKEKYVNQPLDIFLKDLGIPVRSYFRIINHKNRFQVRGVMLYFTDAASMHMSMMNNRKWEKSIQVAFVVPGASDTTDQIYKKSDGAWLDGEADYYGKLLIKDMRLITP
jgi:hypothetical protein